MLPLCTKSRFEYFFGFSQRSIYIQPLDSIDSIHTYDGVNGLDTHNDEMIMLIDLKIVFVGFTPLHYYILTL